jgi:hypothetical protein
MERSYICYDGYKYDEYYCKFLSVPVQDAVKGVILLFPILLLAILWVIQDGEILYLV